MSSYPPPPSVNPYWYYDPHGYQPNVSFNPNLSVNTPPHPSFETYNNSRFADSGYLSRTPTPPTPVRVPSPQPIPMRHDFDNSEIDEHISDKQQQTTVETKSRLPYTKRTRIQYTVQQLQILEEAFQENHYPEVTMVDHLAELLDVRHEKISIWFQNRRSRFKRQQKPKTTSTSVETAKKATSQVQGPSPSYDPSTSYYPPYFWPSPIMENRTATPYSAHTHNVSFYDTNPNPMWNSQANTYSSPTIWQQSASSSSMNLSLSSTASSPHPLHPEHLSSM